MWLDLAGSHGHAHHVCRVYLAQRVRHGAMSQAHEPAAAHVSSAWIQRTVPKNHSNSWNCLNLSEWLPHRGSRRALMLPSSSSPPAMQAKSGDIGVSQNIALVLQDLIRHRNQVFAIWNFGFSFICRKFKLASLCMGATGFLGDGNLRAGYYPIREPQICDTRCCADCYLCL